MAERKRKTSTREPDLGNANVGNTQAGRPEVWRNVRKLASPVSFLTEFFQLNKVKLRVNEGS